MIRPEMLFSLTAAPRDLRARITTQISMKPGCIALTIQVQVGSRSLHLRSSVTTKAMSPPSITWAENATSFLVVKLGEMSPTATSLTTMNSMLLVKRGPSAKTCRFLEATPHRRQLPSSVVSSSSLGRRTELAKPKTLATTTSHRTRGQKSATSTPESILRSVRFLEALCLV